MESHQKLRVTNSEEYPLKFKNNKWRKIGKQNPKQRKES